MTSIWLIAVATIALALPAHATGIDALIRENCGGCHTDPAAPEGSLSRMSEQRKTPEGWEMTLRRMQMLHHAPFRDSGSADDPDEVFARLVKHFADTQGLAPAESKQYRYILERRDNTIDVPEDAEFAVMCSRCHSAARVALQRRTEPEWRSLVHFHMAQFPTIEYQAGGRDRDWLGTALNRTVPMLSTTYPLQTQDWDSWRRAHKPELSGRWRITGRMPGKGDFEGDMRAESRGNDRYALNLTARFGDGTSLRGSGNAIVYTGYEWRANIEVAGVNYLQVLEAQADGARLSGRMFLADHEERGMDLDARRDDGASRLLAAFPAQLQRGESTALTLSGTALRGNPVLGPGVRVEKIVSRDADRIVLKVRATDDASVGPRTVSVGTASLEAAIVVFGHIDRIEVSPAYAVGRVGGSEGSQSEVQARFEAIAWSNGADGKPGTADDLRIGPIDAAWSVAPWDERAAADEDVRFSGAMDKDSGVFTPAGAGPNPARKYHTNNAGSLKVVASVGEGDAAVTGEGHLLVTVQRWNNPPIR